MSPFFEDVADVFSPEASLTELTDAYSERNPDADRKRVSRVLEKLRKIINNHVGIIELAEDLDIETVTEIFIRVNSARGLSSRRPTSPCRRLRSTKLTVATSSGKAD